MADMPAVLFAQTAEDLGQEPPHVFYFFLIDGAQSKH